MYYVTQLVDTLRVPPNRFDDNLQEILLELARESLEARIIPELGFIVSVLEAHEVGKGKLIPQDGGAFYPCEFKVLSYKPERGEIIEGRVVELTEFGAFVQVSTLEALCHMSQIGDDFFRFRASDRALVGKDTGARIDIDSMVRGRIIVVGVQKKAIRVGITMRQSGLGKFEWINEWKQNLLEKANE
jgi:DNA-directed RNA polymerase subunit E'